MNDEISADRDGFAPPVGDMSPDDFRRYGHELIDWIANYFTHLEARDVLTKAQPGDVKNQLPSAPPARGESMDDILADIDQIIAPALTLWNHPSFFAYFATSASAPGIFGELLSAVFDVKAMMWRTAPAATELEQVALDWLRQMMGLDAGYTGIIYDTASVATMHAIAAAREGVQLRIREEGMSGRKDLPLLRVYTSEQAHSSVEKAVLTLGLGQRGLRKIPTDAEFRMDAKALRAAIEEDKAAGYLPFCIVATVGTTSTTSIDPVEEMIAVGEEHAMWLHIDAAYAGSAAIVPEMQHVLRGSERADSVVTNPHKWLFTPFDLSVLYCRHLDLLRGAFALTSEYLKTNITKEVFNGMDYGIQLGRRFRALKLWMILRYFGHEGLAARIREHCRLAQEFASWIKADDTWELLAPVPFALVCFRACPPNGVNSDETASERNARLNDLNERLMHAVNESGKAFLSHTKLNDAFTLRLSIGNIRTTEKHIAEIWQQLQALLEASV